MSEYTSSTEYQILVKHAVAFVKIQTQPRDAMKLFI